MILNIMMAKVKWWKVGFVRILSIAIMAFSLKSEVQYLRLILCLIGVALFVLGYRTQRDDEKLHKLSDS